MFEFFKHDAELKKQEPKHEYKEQESEFFKAGADSIASERHPDKNEDDFFITENGSLGVLDGLGGAEKGDWASAKAKELVEKNLDKICEGKNIEQAKEEIKKLLANVHLALQVGVVGSQTTLNMAKVFKDGEKSKLLAVNIGDSKSYILRKGELIKMVDDDGLPEWLEDYNKDFYNEYKNCLSQALGSGSNVILKENAEEIAKQKGRNALRSQSDIFELLYTDNQSCPIPHFAEHELEEDDLLLFLSDGVTDNLTKDKISEIIKKHPDATPLELCRYINAAAAQNADQADKDKEKKKNKESKDYDDIFKKIIHKGYDDITSVLADVK